jgi:NodT family efflux transporter outer membrane factor (OMF) lipoprotein
MNPVRNVRAAAIATLLAVGGCAIGPNYHRPALQVPGQYRESEGWKPLAPKDDIDRGAWWSVYADPELDQLERKVNVSNQNVKAFEAQYDQAQALVREVRSELFPSIGVAGTATRSRASLASATAANGGSTGGAGAATFSAPTNQFQVSGTANWTLDVWGSIRRQLESQKAAAAVSAADLANARLAAQATLAIDYINLRAADTLIDVLTESVSGYQRTAEITENQYHYGTASRADFMSARAQLEATRAQLIGARQTRGQYEHAIAVLTGAFPSELTISHARLAVEVPVVPVGLPSTLLERNPVIAAAERQMQQENALIGVAEAEYFPAITLTGLVGFASHALPHLVSAANRVWSAEGQAAGTLLDAGGRSGQVAAARAVYRQAVANYHQTVLTTFQGVEDQLLALHSLQEETVAAEAAVEAAKQAAEVALDQYKAGTVAFTTVIVANQSYLSDQQTLLTVQQNRLVASINLIEALGGGWQSPTD